MHEADVVDCAAYISRDWWPAVLRRSDNWLVWANDTAAETCNISETGQDRTMVTTDDQYGLSIGALDDLEGPLRTVFQNTRVFRSPPGKFEWR